MVAAATYFVAVASPEAHASSNVRDPLAGGILELEDFHWLGRSLRAFGVPMFSVLEGGYSRDLPELIFAYLKGVAGLPGQSRAAAEK